MVPFFLSLVVYETLPTHCKACRVLRHSTTSYGKRPTNVNRPNEWAVNEATHADRGRMSVFRKSGIATIATNTIVSSVENLSTLCVRSQFVVPVCGRQSGVKPKLRPGRTTKLNIDRILPLGLDGTGMLGL
ncbi:unnamed protein product, partial [Dovyalis caffra]